MIDYYKLDENKNPIPCSLEEWANQREEMFESKTKHIGSDEINGKWVSTVWLGLNHNFFDGPPEIFETMIYDNEKKEWTDYEQRYATWKEAEEGHLKAIQWVKDGCKE